MVNLRIITVICLVILSGCRGRMRKVSPTEGDVFLTLTTREGASERLQCGVYSANQMIDYYQGVPSQVQKNSDALIFARNNDTVGVLHYLRDNLDFPITAGGLDGESVLERVSEGDPVLAFLPVDAFDVTQLGLFGTSMFHCVVIAGYSGDRSKLYFYSDGEGPYSMDYRTFSRQWARVGNLAIARLDDE